MTDLLRQRGALVEQLDDAIVERVDAGADFFQLVATKTSETTDKHR